ncbi:MAG: hypothetical protein HQ503_05710 [Rhodospirillales bacterium]|nr:hypothetical protein [Rhodospirillales bacterium]
MKLYNTENTVLIDISAVEPDAQGLLIKGKIMGAMPMRAVLTPKELRAAFCLLSVKTFITLLAMLFRRDAKQVDTKGPMARH